ncbi:PRTRC system protein E [Sphingobium sp. GW456-12-10-14-TSB1]|uniref:PRTRC system protein E n=1 Tax=Sphingobium sp. GW456-12-10-14-TSB1 TaxID=1987165 RepID=UPI000A367B91|nr:PRTRC system protein E [Sphingobium sp. GW456-12-10-14-TSB1]OUC54728.1 PRTRC system protein E [Sphingobium sp. GW456-12-10-14-TSB1]
MLITSLLPLLSRYSLGFDLVAGPDGTVTLTVIPRKAVGAKSNPEAGEVRPISITATAAEIDEELAKGEDGALGQLIAVRKGLGDQIAEQRAAAEATKAPAKSKKAEPAKAAPAPAASSEPSAAPKPGEPTSLWDD